MHSLARWKYRLIVWFFDKPDALARRVSVEDQLMKHYAKGTRPTPESCMKMAQKLGVPEWWGKSKKGLADDGGVS